MSSKSDTSVWTAPTRRTFMTMLGLGAAALAVVKVKPEKPAAPVVPGTLWIGHC